MAGEYDGAGRPSAVEEDKAFMVNSLPAHDRPLPVPPTGHESVEATQSSLRSAAQWPALIIGINLYMFS